MHLTREVNMQSKEMVYQEETDESRNKQRKPKQEDRKVPRLVPGDALNGEEKMPRPASADPVGERRGEGGRQEPKRLSAYANISDFRGPHVVGPGQLSSSVTPEWSQSRSSITQESSKTSGHAESSSQSKSRSTSQQRHSSRNTSRFSKTSSGLDTTGSSRALNSSLDSSREDASLVHIQSQGHQDDMASVHASSDIENKHLDSKSYYFGEVPDLKEILADVNDLNNVGHKDPNHQLSAISPHSGEVVRIRVPFNHTEEVPGQFLSSENIQRLMDQQISPSYNGHKVTIQVNRSTEALTSTVDRRARHKASGRQRKVGIRHILFTKF